MMARTVSPNGRAFRSWHRVQGQSRGKEVYRPVRDYELVFVVHPTVDPDGLTAVTENVQALVERGGGTVVKLDPWGLRRLAYPIQDVWEGQYVLMRLEMDPQAVAPLERSLKLLEEVMRHLIVRVEE